MIVFGESNPETWKEWLDDLRYNTQLKTGCRPFVREIKFLDINYPEEDEEEFLKKIVPNEGFGHIGAPKGLSKIMWLLRKVFPKMKSLDKEKAKIKEEMKEGKILPYKFDERGKWLYLYIVGKFEDRYDEYGTEMI